MTRSRPAKPLVGRPGDAVQRTCPIGETWSGSASTPRPGTSRPAVARRLSSRQPPTTGRLAWHSSARSPARSKVTRSRSMIPAGLPVERRRARRPAQEPGLASPTGRADRKAVCGNHRGDLAEGESSLVSSILHHLAHRELEPGQDLASVDDLPTTEGVSRGRRFMVVDLALIGIHHPHPSHAGLEVALEARVDPIGRFRFTFDLDHEVGDDVPDVRRGHVPIRRPPLERDEGEVGMELLLGALAPVEEGVLRDMADPSRLRTLIERGEEPLDDLRFGFRSGDRRSLPLEGMF